MSRVAAINNGNNLIRKEVNHVNNTSCAVEGDSSTNTNEYSSATPAQGPLALHIRSLRQWYGKVGLSQAELAGLAGLSPRHLRRYESSRALPFILEALLSIALVLKVPLESLIDPERLERLKQAVEARRTAQEEGTVADRGDTSKSTGYAS